MTPQTYARAYQAQSVLTASPGQLVLLMYDGAQRFMAQARAAFALPERTPRRIENINTALLRAQAGHLHFAYARQQGIQALSGDAHRLAAGLQPGCLLQGWGGRLGSDFMQRRAQCFELRQQTGIIQPAGRWRLPASRQHQPAHAVQHAVSQVKDGRLSCIFPVCKR